MLSSVWGCCCLPATLCPRSGRVIQAQTFTRAGRKVAFAAHGSTPTPDHNNIAVNAWKINEKSFDSQKKVLEIVITGSIPVKRDCCWPKNVCGRAILNPRVCVDSSDNNLLELWSQSSDISKTLFLEEGFEWGLTGFPAKLSFRSVGQPRQQGTSSSNDNVSSPVSQSRKDSVPRNRRSQDFLFSHRHRAPIFSTMLADDTRRSAKHNAGEHDFRWGEKKRFFYY